jgi:adenylate cyclase
VAEAEWVAAGLLDPDDPEAGERRELLEWLEAQGFTSDQLRAAAASENLQSLAGDTRLRPAPTLTREEVASRCGLAPEGVDRAWLAAGFPPPPSGVPFFREEELALFAVVPLAQDLFGEDTLLAFTRVMGTSLARIAEAADAMFLTDVEEPRRSGGVTERELAQAIDLGSALLADLPAVLAPLFRRHAAAAIDRSRLARSGMRGSAFIGPYRVPLAVAFADLVGFTALTEACDPRQLAAVVGRFERTASERAVAAGARLVKSIGDAVMIVGSDPVAVVGVVEDLVEAVAHDDDLTGLRAAVAFGEVLAREGDYVGSTVNLAARATKEAPVNGVVVNDPVAAALSDAGRSTTPLEPRQLRGIDHPVVLSLVAGR